MKKTMLVALVSLALAGCEHVKTTRIQDADAQELIDNLVHKKDKFGNCLAIARVSTDSVSVVFSYVPNCGDAK